MTTLRRLTTTLRANFDWMISQVENHEALVDSAIHEIVSSRAKASVQLNRVRKDGEELNKRIVNFTEEEERWKERALKSKEIDEKRALECLKRRKRVIRERDNLQSQFEAHKKLEDQLTKDMLMIDERIDALKRKRNALRTRQSRAEALRTAQMDDNGIIHEIDNIFERWEIKVTQYECEGECTAPANDALEQEFLNEEEESTLRAELQELQ